MSTTMWRVGDQVQLRSGGPVMTVAEDCGDCEYICRWFVGTDSQLDRFPGDVLQKPVILAGPPPLQPQR